MTTYTDAQLPLVLAACEGMNNHLTAAIVSNDALFVNKARRHARAHARACGARARRVSCAPRAHAVVGTRGVGGWLARAAHPRPRARPPALIPPSPPSARAHTRRATHARLRLQVLGSTVNGTTYAGLRARTTGAPQNHWFGPAGDPRAAGIGTPEAIRLVWCAQRTQETPRRRRPAAMLIWCPALLPLLCVAPRRSCHREVIHDVGPVDEGWTLPPPS